MILDFISTDRRVRQYFVEKIDSLFCYKANLYPKEYMVLEYTFARNLFSSVFSCK